MKKLKLHNPLKYFRNPKKVASAMFDALDTKDMPAFKQILEAFLMANVDKKINESIKRKAKDVHKDL